MADWITKNMGRRYAQVALLALCFQFSGALSHAFEIRIRGKAHVEARVNNASTMLQVTGNLRDDLGRGLRERPVKVTISQNNSVLSTSTIRTKTQGSFFLREEFPPGRYMVKVAFEGDQLLDGDAQQWNTTLEKGKVELQIMAPEFVHNPDKVILHASSRSNNIPLVGTLRVFVNGQESTDLVLDKSGRGGLDILNQLKPGMNQIRVSLPGSSFREEIVKERQLRYAKRLTLTAAGSERLERLNRGLGVRGSLTDELGGIKNQSIVVRISNGDGKLETFLKEQTRTDDNGEFSTFFSADKLKDGHWSIEVSASPRGQKETIQAEGVDWNTSTERFVLNAFALIAFLGALVLLFSVFKIRIQNRNNTRRERRDKKRKRELAFVKDDRIVPTLFSDEPGIEIDRKKIGGVVVDAWKTENFTPVQGATISIRSQSETFELLSNADGRFESDLPLGDYQLEVSKFGFVQAKHAFSIPHSGVLSNFKIDFVPVPLKIRRLFEAISEEKGGRAFWGFKTPQEIEKILKLAWPEMETLEDGSERKRIREALKPFIASNNNEGVETKELLTFLSSIVEESYFSGQVYSEETWFFMRSLALRLVENK